MAIQVSGTDVINQNRELVNVNAISGGVVATEAEAEAGTNTNKVITPATLKVAIEAMSNTLPDIQNEGWSGDHKGGPGYGFFTMNASNKDLKYWPNTATYNDPNMMQDQVQRNCSEWATNKANKTSAILTGLWARIQNTSQLSVYEWMMLFPSDVTGKTLDLYFTHAYDNTYNESYPQTYPTITAVTTRTGVNAALTIDRTKVFDNPGAQTYGKGDTWRLRISNLPNIGSLKFDGAGSTTFNNVWFELAYYEIY